MRRAEYACWTMELFKVPAYNPRCKKRIFRYALRLFPKKVHRLVLLIPKLPLNPTIDSIPLACIR